MADPDLPEDRLADLLSPLPARAVGPVATPPFEDVRRRGVRRRRARTGAAAAALVLLLGGTVAATALGADLSADRAPLPPAGPPVSPPVSPPPGPAAEVLAHPRTFVSTVAPGPGDSLASFWSGPRGAWVAVLRQGGPGSPEQAVVLDGPAWSVVPTTGGWLLADAGPASVRVLGLDGGVDRVEVSEDVVEPAPGDVAWVDPDGDVRRTWLYRPGSGRLHPAPPLPEGLLPGFATVTSTGVLVASTYTRGSEGSAGSAVREGGAWATRTLVGGPTVMAGPVAANGPLAAVTATGDGATVSPLLGLLVVDTEYGNVVDVPLPADGPRLYSGAPAVLTDGGVLLADGEVPGVFRVDPLASPALGRTREPQVQELASRGEHVVGLAWSDPDQVWESFDNGRSWSVQRVPGS